MTSKDEATEAEELEERIRDSGLHNTVQTPAKPTQAVGQPRRKGGNRRRAGSPSEGGSSKYLPPDPPPPIPMPEGEEKALELSRQELYDLVWSHSILAIAKAWGYSDVAIAKRCRYHQIPKPKPGDWAKMASGRPVARPALPKVNYEKPIAFWVLAPRPKASDSPKEEPPVPTIPVPSELDNPHPLVSKTEKALLKAKTDEKGLLRLRGKGIVPVTIGPGSIKRTMLILDTMLKAMQEKGISVDVEVKETVLMEARYDPYKRKQVPATMRFENTAYANVEGERICLDIEEKTRRKKEGTSPSPAKGSAGITGTSRPRYEYEPNGRLHIYIGREGYSSYFHWHDLKKVKLEDDIAGIIASFEAKAERIKEERRQAHEEYLRAQEEQRRREEAERRRRIELNRRDHFYQDVMAWRFVKDAREYIAARGAKMDGLDEAAVERETRWLKWVEGYLAKVDPCGACIYTLEDYDADVPEPEQPRSYFLHRDGRIDELLKLTTFPRWLQRR